MKRPKLVRVKSVKQAVHYPLLTKEQAGGMERDEFRFAQIDPELAECVGASDWQAFLVFDDYLKSLDNKNLCEAMIKVFRNLPVGSWEQCVLMEALERLGFDDGE